MPKYILSIISVIVLAGGVLLMVGERNELAEEFALVLSAVSSTDQRKGSEQAKIVIVEYSDFQCPACAAYYPIIKELTRELGDQIVFAYRHFPLRQIHVNADLAARAAEAAGMQGKFWEMHDALFERQKEWAQSPDAKPLFSSYAVFLGLDVGKFNVDVESEKIIQKVEADLAGGMASRVNATPTFFLNGKKLNNPRNYDEFKNTVIKELGEE